MRSLSRRRIVSAVIVLSLFAGILILIKRWRAADFSDNPAWLIEVSDSGTVTLLSYQGEITGRLSGVNWLTNRETMAKSAELIRLAQHDKVAFAKLKDGTLKIWYETESGPECLNEKLIALFANRIAPILK